MSEEIKEILYYFEKYHFEDTMIDGKETKLLYDYITDLQNQLQQKEKIIKEVRDLFYEKCRLKDSNGRYSFNEVDIDDFRKLLDKGE